MTKLRNPRGWLGYFVRCESEAMYHIYSPEKHKVYRIDTARVEDGEGLDDPHDAPCLEDRVPTADVVISDQIDLDIDDEMASDQNDDDRTVSLALEETELYTEPERSDAEDGVQQRQSSHTNPYNEFESDNDTTAPAVMSKYLDMLVWRNAR